MKTILWLPMLSMRCYKCNKWLLQNDGNFLKARNIIKQIIQEHDDYRFALVVPEKNQIEGIEDYYELFKDFEVDKDRIIFVPIFYPLNALTIRFHFDIKEWNRTLLPDIDLIDLIINDISELTLNIKAWLKIYAKKEIPIISHTTHFADIKDNKGYELDYATRQLDGYKSSDKFLITRQYNLDRFIKLLSLNALEADKLELIDYGISSEELEKYKCEKSKENIIFFISRLSDDTRTKYSKFIEYINNLYEKRKDFKVVFANVNDSINWDYLKENVKPIKIVKTERLSRQEYIELLYKSKVVPLLYDTDKVWSLGLYEALYANCYVANKIEDIEKALDRECATNLADNLVGYRLVEKRISSFVKWIEDTISA